MLLPLGRLLPVALLRILGVDEERRRERAGEASLISSTLSFSSISPSPPDVADTEVGDELVAGARCFLVILLCSAITLQAKVWEA